MSGQQPAADSWGEFTESLRALQLRIKRSRAVNVNAQGLRDDAKSVVQKYFREARPDLRSLGLTDSDLGGLDSIAQDLLRLANGANSKRTYLATLTEAREATAELEVLREMRLGERRQTAPRLTPIEQAIVQTLASLAPTAARSYEQALTDLSDERRVSFRGPAHDLREALREVLDRLAPDKDVEGEPGYKPEKGRAKPTQRQKTRYILKSRGKSAKARKTPEETIALVDELTSSLMRSSYERASVAAHVASTKAEVLQLKMYVDTVLAEILEIHRAG